MSKFGIWSLFCFRIRLFVTGFTRSDTFVFLLVMYSRLVCRLKDGALKFELSCAMRKCLSVEYGQYIGRVLVCSSGLSKCR